MKGTCNVSLYEYLQATGFFLCVNVLFDDSSRFFSQDLGGGRVNIRSVFEQYTGCFLLLFFLSLIFFFS